MLEQQLREALERAWTEYQQAPTAEKAKAKKQCKIALRQFADLVLHAEAKWDRAKLIRELRLELRQVERRIARLEEALRKEKAPRRPERQRTRVVGPEERKQISERMRCYWAARKKEGQAGPKRPGQ